MASRTSAALMAALPSVCLTVGGATAQDLTFSVMESGTLDVAAREVAAELAAQGGPNVEVVAFPWAVLRQNNTTDLISGTGQYDVMSGGYYLADVYGFFQPLDDLIEADNYGEGMIENLMLPGRSEWQDGQQIGIPYGIDAYALIFNSELLEQAGMEPTFDSWGDVIAACPTIEETTGKACLSHPTGSPEQIGAFFFSAYDGTYINSAGGYELETEPAIAAAEQIVGLWEFLPENGTAMSFDEAHQVFRDGEAALLVTWPSFVSNSLDAEDSPMRGKWGMTTFPGDGFPWLSLWQIFLPAATDDRETAWEWIKAFAGPDRARANFVDHNINSVWKATYEDPELAAANSHFWPAQIEGFAAAKNPPLSGEAQDFLTNTMQDVANGRVSAADAIASINTTWSAIPVPSALLEAAEGADLVAQ